MNFFDKFPKIYYDIFKDNRNKKILFSNIFVRIDVLNEIKNNGLSYYEYLVHDNETIESIAEKIYGSPEYHWLIIMTNDMTDPLFDWVKNYDEFKKYIISKYGSVENAMTQIHHYEKIITRTQNSTNTSHVTKIIVDANTYTSLASSSLETFNLQDNSTIEEVITKDIIYCYDWEEEQNEAKRSIKLIKPQYIPQIQAELDNILVEAGSKTIQRGLRSLR